MFRELSLADVGIDNIHDLIIMEDEKTLVLSDPTGLHPIDIEHSVQAEKCKEQGKSIRLVKLRTRSIDGLSIFAACYDDG